MAVFCLVMVFAALSTAVLILSFLGPEKSRSSFWIIIQKMRSLLDLFCYGVFCAFAGLSLFLAVMYGINRLIARWTGTGEGASVYAATISAILFTMVFLILGIRSFRKQYHEGELCDCTGDCEHCTIRCRSNPAFYGLKSSDSENGRSVTRTDI